MKRLIVLCFLLLPALILAQAASVTFQVNMNYQIELSAFNPATEFVDVAGSFNGWGGDLTRLDDPENDGIYTVTVAGFQVGQSIEFKFRQNGSWDGTEEFPGVGNNRTYTVEAGENTLLYWYNNEVSPNGPPVAGFISDDPEVYENAVVTFVDQSSGNVTFRDWYFPGGLPERSAEINPRVRYTAPGVYDATLIVGNDNGQDTLLFQNAVTVQARNRKEVEWWNNTVFYEIFVRSFYDSNGDGIGDFNGLTQKLDYLNDGDPSTTDDLGITGIWLMPIHDSPSYHGYDVIDYKGINPDYGTMEDFRAFLDAAHERGIRVIIDYVMNHSSSDHPWFLNSASGPEAERRSWYRWNDNNPGYNGPWGQEVWHLRQSGWYYGLFWGGMPDLNYEEPAVQDTMFDIASYWLEDLGIDGFRLDAVKYIFEDGTQLEDTRETFQFFRDFRSHYKASNPEAVTVGEAWTNTEQVLKYVEEDGLDFCFEFDLASSMLGAINAGNTINLSQQLQKVYNLYPHLQYGTFLTNHDINRVMNILGNDVEKMKAAAALYLTTPGVPFIYYGEEIGMNGQKPDPDIRLPMQWSSTSYGGFTSGRPWRDPNGDFTVKNVANQENDPNSLLNWYKQLIHLRNQEIGLQEGDILVLESSSPHVLSFLRTYRAQQYLVLINLSSIRIDNITIFGQISDLKPGNFTAEELISGNSATVIVGTSKRIEGLEAGPYQTQVFKLQSTTSSAVEPTDRQLSFFPNPVTDRLFIQTKNTMFGTLNYQLLNTQGQIIRSGQLPINGQPLELNLSGLPQGIYILKGQNQHFSTYYQFVKL